MRKLLVGLVLLVGLSTPAYADAVTVSWKLAAGATSYKLYQSVDLGVTWTLIATVPAPPVVVNIPSDKLVLMVVSGINSVGETVNRSHGTWYNAVWDTSPRSLVND